MNQKICPIMSSGKPDKVKCDQANCAWWTYNRETGESGCAAKVLAEIEVASYFKIVGRG